MSVFKNLGEEKAIEMMKEFITNGMSDDDAYMEIYSIECNLDDDTYVEV